MSSIKSFISELKLFQSEVDVFNPWKDYDKENDIGSEAPLIRADQLEKFLQLRIGRAKYILVGEAVGYQGGRFTGVALTSERLLLGFHKRIDPGMIIPPGTAKRTSNPNSPQLKHKVRRDLGFAEPTATIVWQEVVDCGIMPLDVVTWNIFPFHPYDKAKGSLSNRAPRANEIKIGKYYFEQLIALFPEATVVSIGTFSSEALGELGIKRIHVPHPSNGGAKDFRNAFGKLFSVN